MRKTIILILAALQLCSLAASAADRTVIGGLVAVENLDIARNDHRLYMTMDFDLSDLRLRSDEDITLTPVVMTPDSSESIVFESVVIAGRNAWYQHLRHNDLGGARLYRCGEQATLRYTAQGDDAAWLDDAVVKVRLTEGCCLQSKERSGEVARLRRPRFTPVYNYMTPVGDSVKVRDLSRRAYINFPVNRTEMYPDYMTNPQELAKIIHTIDSVKNDPDITITSIFIKGFASPEGPWDNNVRLARGRTATLKEYVETLYKFPHDFIKTAYEPEDWEGLRDYLEHSSLANRDALLAIVNSDLEPDAKDHKLRRDFPVDYKLILTTVYPWLRHSDYRIEYVIRSFTTLEEILHALRTAPQKLSLSEFYRAAQSMPVGSAEYNEVFEIAVRMYPADVAANLNAANTAMRRGDYEAARSYLDKCGDDPTAVYARGILAALQEDYDAAEEWFARAAKLKVADAPTALSQIKAIKEYNRDYMSAGK